MTGIVLYMSKAGSTREYAEMIGKETGYKVVDLAKDKKPDLSETDIVIIGSWILANRMVARSWIRKNWSLLKEKRVIIFSTSAADPDIKLKREFLEGSFPEEISSRMEYFPLQGRFRKEDLNLIYRGFMGLAERMFKDDQLVRDLSKGVDGVRRENLDGLLSRIRDIRMSQKG